MLYTATDMFYFHFVVKYLTKEINACPHFRDAFDFSKISPGQLSNLGRGNAEHYADEMSYCKNETKNYPIVEFVGMRSTMY